MRARVAFIRCPAAQTDDHRTLRDDGGPKGAGFVLLARSRWWRGRWHWKVSPFVTLDTTIGEPVPELAPVAPRLLEVQVAVYELIGDEPGSDGALNATLIDALPGVG